MDAQVVVHAGVLLAEVEGVPYRVRSAAHQGDVGPEGLRVVGDGRLVVGDVWEEEESGQPGQERNLDQAGYGHLNGKAPAAPELGDHDRGGADGGVGDHVPAVGGQDRAQRQAQEGQRHDGQRPEPTSAAPSLKDVGHRQPQRQQRQRYHEQVRVGVREEEREVGKLGDLETW